MFNTISWDSYWTAISLTTAVYYLFVYLVYFRKGFAQRLSFRSQSIHPAPLKRDEGALTLFEQNSPEFVQPEKDTEEHVVYACMDELNAFFENQKKSKSVKAEVMFALHTILQKYPSLKTSEYKDSLTNVLATQCEAICSIHLSADELKGVWFG